MRIERQVLFWFAALAVLVLTVGMLREVLLPFVLGMVLAYFMNPIVDRLTSFGLGRVVASVIVVAGLVAAFASLAVYVLPIIAAQAHDLALALPGELERISGLIDLWAREQLGARYPQFESGLAGALKSLSDNWTNLAGWIGAEVLSRGRGLFQILSILLVTPLVMFYLLIDWHPMLAKIDRWLPRDHADTIRAVASDVNDAVSAFIRGQGTVCLILGIYYSIALSLAGLDYALLVGVATGLMSFVPFVGWALGLITASTLAIMQHWPDAMPLVWVVAVFLGAQALDAGFLSPKIVGSKIGLHPVWLILALFVFSYLFGFMGTLVAVPVAAALAVLVRFGLQHYLNSEVYRGRELAHSAQITAVPKEMP